MTKFCANPLLMLLNPESKAAKDKKQVPIFIYEDSGDISKFAALEFTLASSDSEQIAVDGVAHAVDPDAKVSSFSQSVNSSLNAIKILRSKLNFIITAVQKSPEVRQNQNFMRRLNQIVNSTPIAARELYDSQSFAEFSDAQALNLLASVTKSCGQLQSLIEDFNVVQVGRGGAARGEERRQ